MPAADYTKYRTGAATYTIEDIIGRGEGVDKIATTVMTASGTAALLPTNPLGRRNYIKVINEGAVDVVIGDINLTTASGFTIAASGGTWEDTTDSIFYIMSTGADSIVRIYERSTR